MSLEEALNRNSDLVAKNNDLMERLLGAAAATKPAAGATTAASSDEGDEKPKPTRKKKDDKSDDAGTTEAVVTLEDVKPILNGWLTEFPKNGDNDHPETVARKEALKGAFKKLGAENLKEVPAEKFIKLKEWAEAQIAKGRLVPDEAPEKDEDDDMLG